MPDMQKPLAFMRSQLFFTPPYPTKRYTDQTIIVTGSNAGLGLEASRHFVRLDAAKVILAVRNLEKGEAAKRSIEQSTGRTGVVEVWQLDLAHYESVRFFAKRAMGLERLDVVVENAGILTGQFKRMEENESSVTTNVVSTVLHALLLLPKLRETGAKFNILPRSVSQLSRGFFFPPPLFPLILEFLSSVLLLLRKILILMRSLASSS